MLFALHCWRSQFLFLKKAQPYTYSAIHQFKISVYLKTPNQTAASKLCLVWNWSLPWKTMDSPSRRTVTLLQWIAEFWNSTLSLLRWTRQWITKVFIPANILSVWWFMCMYRTYKCNLCFMNLTSSHWDRMRWGLLEANLDTSRWNYGGAGGGRGVKVLAFQFH